MSGDDLEAVHQRLDRHEEKLDRLVEAMSEHLALCEPTQSRLEAVCLTVYGNGRDGLVTRIDRMETMRRMTGQLVAGVVGLLAGAGGALIPWLLEH